MKSALAIAPWALALIIALWSLFPKHEINPDSELALHWHQPKLLDKQFPRPIYQGNWDFDFSHIEMSLAKIDTNDTGHIILDEATLTNLEKAYSRVPSNAPEAVAKRILFLIEIGNPGAAGKQLSELMDHFSAYHAAQSALDEKTGNTRELSSALEKFNQSKNLQDLYFGRQIAAALFKQKRGLTQYLLERRAIVENKTLSADRKKLNLQALRVQFQASYTQ